MIIRVFDGLLSRFARHEGGFEEPGAPVESMPPVLFFFGVFVSGTLRPRRYFSGLLQPLRRNGRICGLLQTLPSLTGHRGKKALSAAAVTPRAIFL